MENAGVQNKQTAGTPSGAFGLWDPFWFMRQMFGWGRSANAPSFDVKETDDTYVCKVNVKLTLPEQADVAHAKAELDNGELTLVVPKALAATPEPQPKAEPEGEQESESASPPAKTRRGASNGRGSTGRAPRRGARSSARRG